MVIRRRGPGARGSQREAGYNLVFLMVMITLLNILIAKALPLWSAVIQREKEAELIFRGMQYAEALRVYEMRTGALPTKLEQLVEVKPRCIRKLWKNPMSEDGSWLLIPPGQGQQLGGQNLNQRPDPRRRDDGRGRLPGDPSQPDQGLLWVPGGDNEIGAVAIFGVKSSVGGESIKTFVVNPNAPGDGGSNEISDWQFTVDLAKALILKPTPDNPTVPSMNVAQRFRPWPPGVRPVNVPAHQGGGMSPVQPGGQRSPRPPPGGPTGGTQRRSDG